MPNISELIAQLRTLAGDLTLRQKIITGLVLAGVVAAFAGLILFTNQTVYKVLYSDLNPEDASQIVTWLKNEKIPYKLKQGGAAVLVPEDQVYDVRLALASSGLPGGSGVGFEIFDRSGLGTTDFVQHINFQRALQGELERTIASFPQVKTARVHLATPKESLFVTEQREPTASVVLGLKNGQELDRGQVKGIVHLVASAVPRLTKDHISVVDTTGNVLYDPSEPADGLDSRTNAQLVYHKRLEEYYKHKIQSMLEKVLGPNKAVARVSAELDFNQVEITEENFDPDMVAVRSEQKLLETSTDAKAGGVPGVKGGLADKLQGNANANGTNLRKTKEKKTTNYEISKRQRQIRAAQGTLKKLSVAVLVDGTYKKENKKEVYVPRSEEEMANLERIVKAAMGFSEERGDEVSVVNVPFTDPTPKPSAISKVADLAPRLIRPLANLIIGLLFILMVLRPLLKRYVFTPAPGEETSQEGLPGEALEGLEGESAKGLPVLEALPNPKEELRELATDYPERAAALVKVWLREKVEGEGDAKPASP